MIKRGILLEHLAAHSQYEARLALIAAATFLLLVAILHVVKSELNPSWHVISEYAREPFGWVMQLAFFCLSLSCIALVVALWPYVPALGLKLLAVAAIGAAGAGLFITDPITVAKNDSTPSSILHGVFSLIFIFGFPIAVTVVGRSLADNQLWASIQNVLPWVSALVWIGFLAFFGSGIFFTGGKRKFGPEAPIGWPQRFMVVWVTGWPHLR